MIQNTTLYTNSAPQVLTITNPGTAPLTIGVVVLSAGNVLDFLDVTCRRPARSSSPWPRRHLG